MKNECQFCGSLKYLTSLGVCRSCLKSGFLPTPAHFLPSKPVKKSPKRVYAYKRPTRAVKESNRPTGAKITNVKVHLPGKR